MKLRALLGATAAALLLAATATVALGHAELVESNPADGATITTPYKLTATFDEELSTDPTLSFISIVDEAGVEVARGQVSPDDPAVMEAELPALPAGEYTARWQANTPDDDATERDSFSFTVVAVATHAPTGATPGATAAPQPTGTGGTGGEDGQNTGGGNDLLVALVVAAVAIGAIAVFVFARMRRP